MKAFFVLISLSLYLNTLPILAMKDVKRVANQKYYFLAFEEKKGPITPRNEVSEEVAKTKDVFYIVYFNQEGKVYISEKYLNNEILFRNTYEYGTGGKIARIRSEMPSTQKASVSVFDEQGNLISQSEEPK